MDRKAVGTVVVVVLMVTAGCVGVGNDAGDAGGGDGADGDDGARMDGGDAGDGSDDVARQQSPGSGGEDTVRRSAPQQDDRHVIRTADISVTVDSFADARANLTAAARADGGYLSDSERQTHERGNETWTTGRLTFRVPSENFEAFRTTAEAQGNVTTATVESEDVTDQLVDIEARLENLRSQRDRLRDLYDDANETEDVLAVGDRLSEVQEDIERLEAQRASLREQVAYSTVTVRLAEPEPEPETDADEDEEDEAAFHRTPIAEAFLSSVQGVITLGRTLVVLGAYAAPYLLAVGTVIGIPVGLVGLVRRRRGRSSSSESRDEE